ncbi:uncharacterized protein ASPGLDRAFT_1290912 [Aspergillus glaucus CBS 516.65]|uniref:Uncharacterized protein n=1 Tax=Aspergillus glaucus CBS 516.65 TaxID=1160497 RepID=A0A1L9VPT4_ASPGL|nr:hypothetical protein ASPGLDRAFT_1290912 [Aspergillus glaucus CBS 516.65]OJJ85894.1 hypothetical protein ASPGLDRAFT_1290912 [Aspergillus glaucus CBS 516.65]
MPSGGPFYAAAKPAVLDRLEASIFLRDVLPPIMLYSLKFLEIIFPPTIPGCIFLGSPAHQNWIETISYVQGKLNLPRLTLRIYFPNLRSFQDKMLHRKSALTREEGMQSIVSMHESITSPLSQLGNRLSRCFVHAVWPLTWRFSTMQSNMQEVERDLVQIERSLERRIMGNDGYDSRTTRGNEPERSQWLQRYD